MVTFLIKGDFSGYSVDFGDGITSSGSVFDGTCSEVSFTPAACDATHKYTQTGIYTVTLSTDVYDNDCAYGSTSTPCEPYKEKVVTKTITVR